MEIDEYSILNSKHFIGIHGYMLVYSVSFLPTFEMVQVIREKILNHLSLVGSPPPPSPPLFLTSGFLKLSYLRRCHSQRIYSN